MEVAAQEFATYGFDDASVNRILEAVQMSKGAAYYYFEDKVDLFFTVIQYCIERLNLFVLELEPATLTAESFWPTFATRSMFLTQPVEISEMCRKPFIPSYSSRST